MRAAFAAVARRASTVTSVAFTTATASEPGSSPSSRAASALIRASTRVPAQSISARAMTVSPVTEVASPTRRLRADRPIVEGSATGGRARVRGAASAICVCPPSTFAVRNHRRGYQLSIPTGQAVAEVLSLAPPTHEELKQGNSERSGTTCSRRPTSSRTNSLAELGSRIVVETLVGQVRHDPGSFIAQSPTWVPKDGVLLPDGRPILAIKGRPWPGPTGAAPPSQAAPGRQDDVLRSTERRPDRDVASYGAGAAGVPMWPCGIKAQVGWRGNPLGCRRIPEQVMPCVAGPSHRTQGA